MNDTSKSAGTPSVTKPVPRAGRWAVAAAAVAALALPWPAQAWSGGEALEIEGPSMRTPVPDAAPSAAATRADVRNALAVARAWNMLPAGGEIGDTPQVLAQREIHNSLQAAELHAIYRQLALQQAAAQAVPQQISLAQLFQMLDQAAADGSVVLLWLSDDGEEADDAAFPRGVDL